jgi:arylsulfatase A-like enzyme
MNRRSFLSSVAVGAPALLKARAPQRPNILFILADDLGYGDLGCYGQSQIQTPNLDRLAADGMRFTQAYAGATVCAPSRCCLMTGKHTGHATVRGNKKPEVGLRADEPTVASLLKGAGYRTALFGKWGLGGPGTGSVPNTRGFDEFYGYLDQQHAHNSYPEHLWDNQNEVMLTGNWFWQKKQFSNDLFTARALGFLENQSAADPFFLYLPYTIPHANNELGTVQANGMENPDFGPYGSKAWPEVEKTFAASITRMDSDIGRVLTLLDKRGLSENTLVLFSSDNGPHKEGNHDAKFFESSGGVRGTKRELTDGGIRVPAMARWKRRIRPGQVSQAPWAFWDILPTACELAGVASPKGIDGHSIVPTLMEGKTVARDYFYWEFHEGGFAQAIRKDNWKLIRQKPKFELELYDLATDPMERRNLAAERKDITQTLLPLFREARTDNPNFPVK